MSVLAVACALSSGCMSTHHHRPTQLAELADHTAPSGGAAGLHDVDGRWVEVDPSTTVYLRLRGGSVVEEHFQRLEIEDGRLGGVTVDGARVDVPVEQIEAVETREFHGEKTTALVIFGVLATGALFGALMFADSSNGDSGAWVLAF